MELFNTFRHSCNFKICRKKLNTSSDYVEYLPPFEYIGDDDLFTSLVVPFRKYHIKKKKREKLQVVHISIVEPVASSLID